MTNKKRKHIVGVLAVLVTSACCTFYAYAAPTITIQKGNPPDKQKPPCTISFSVADAAGVVSIVVNGRELGPNGGDYYEGDYSTYYNGTIHISAVNRNGESSSKAVTITNLSTAVEQTERPQMTPPAQTAAPAPAQTAAPVPEPAPAPAPAPTKANVQETTQAKKKEPKPVETTAREPERESEQVEPETMEENTGEEMETSAEETTEVENEGNGENKDEKWEGEKIETTETHENVEETKEPELPSDSYKLYPGGRKNKMVPTILISACICEILYMVTTILLNKKRLKKYKELYDVLVKRQDLISQRKFESTVEGLPEDQEDEDRE